MVQYRFDPTAAPQCFCTTEGLQVRLIQLPGGSQAAALVRVHAGAHDAPSAYPGLAHFLEHLLFLGSHAYPVEQSLMPFVQGCGGQLNASTRERHTDFFFQLPAEALEGGLQRLLDMLARPLLDPAAQLREREVLQAEYLARAQDSETLCDAAIGTALRAPHPFAAFHAGNRASLPVESAQFQQALQGYHQRFYHAGTLELLVAAPLDVAQLQTLLKTARCQFAVRPQPPRTLQPLLAESHSLRLQLDSGRPRLDLAFCLDGMPSGSAAALDFLGSCLQSEAPNSLFETLRDAGWVDGLELRVPYWHAGQGVVVVEFALTEQGLPMRAGIAAALQAWLRFLADETTCAHCWDEYVRERQRSLHGMEPLARLRYWIEPEPELAFTAAPMVRQALRVLLERLQTTPIRLTADQRPCAAIETAGFPLRIAAEPLPAVALRDWHWRLPPCNPWLQASAPLATQPLDEPALHCLGPEDGGGQGALYLRWRFDGASPEPALWHVLHSALRTPIWAARQAGVDLRFEDYGSSWCLSLFGYAAALPRIAGDLLALLHEPPASAFASAQRQLAAADRLNGDELLIRQLIRRLPRLLSHASPVVESEPDQMALGAAWARAHWDALAVGLSSELNGALRGVLRDMPGAPQRTAGAQPCSDGEGLRRWWSIGEVASETAVLLFCPLPARSIRVEAAWRTLARLLEGDFFRRLRSELQLGYAVFSGFRQFGEHAGILFAVQSPSASAAQIIEHIQDFLDSFADKLGAGAFAPLDGGMGARQDGQLTDLRRRAEHVWQACLADQDAEYPAQVAAALGDLQPDELRAALAALRTARGGWIGVANAPAPSAGWQPQ